jgi:hypothetical protein
VIWVTAYGVGCPKKSGPLKRSRRGHHHSHDKDPIRNPSLLLCSPAIIKMVLYALAIGASSRSWRKDSHDYWS